MSQYPEHDKLTVVAAQTQAIGDFLEWAAANLDGARLMRYVEQADWRGWAEPRGSVQDWLAGWAGIDRDKLEAEKRAMLAAIRERSDNA